MQRFFCSGVVKSGTTFLQCLLDAHPAISCLSEQNTAGLLGMLGQLGDAYRQKVSALDELCANRGLPFSGDVFLRSDVVRQMLLALMAAAETDCTTHSGFNDNSLLLHGDLLVSLFPDAKFVFIVRDPRDVGVSLWHHAYRNTDADKRPHLDDAGRNDAIARTMVEAAGIWRKYTEAMLSFVERYHRQTHIVRYEDLLGPDKDMRLVELLDFLGARHSADVRAQQWAATDFTELKQLGEASSGEPGFFRSGRAGGWTDVRLRPEQYAAFRELEGLLRQFRYPPVEVSAGS